MYTGNTRLVFMSSCNDAPDTLSYTRVVPIIHIAIFTVNVCCSMLTRFYALFHRGELPGAKRSKWFVAVWSSAALRLPKLGEVLVQFWLQDAGQPKPGVPTDQHMVPRGARVLM